MEALVLGRPGIERARLEELLADADHHVNVCQDSKWGCVGMEGDCPLDDLSIDVAVAVADPGDRFDPQGIACVHRARIPIVTIGATAGDPVLKYATKSIARVDRSVVAALRVAARDASGHQRVIEDSLTTHLGSGEHVEVSVRRTATSVHVTIVGHFDAARTAALADVARVAVRAHDSHVAVIDVSVVDASMD